MMEVMVTTGAISCASSSQIIITNKPTPNFLTGRMPFLSVNQQLFQSIDGNERKLKRGILMASIVP